LAAAAHGASRGLTLAHATHCRPTHLTFPTHLTHPTYLTYPSCLASTFRSRISH
jgi:hypothetical protein